MTSVTIRFGRVMDELELSARMSELTDEQYQAVIQMVQMVIETCGTLIDRPALEALEMKHHAGGMYWARTLLDHLHRLRQPPRQEYETEPLVEI